MLTSHADLKKDIRSEVANALDDFMLHDNASSSISQGRNLNSISEEIMTLRDNIEMK